MMSAYVQAIPVSPKLGLQIALEKVSIFKVAITGTRLCMSTTAPLKFMPSGCEEQQTRGK